MSTPNVIFVFADQWRYQATGFGGDPNVQTPHLDALANRSLHFRDEGSTVATRWIVDQLFGS